MSSGVKSMRSPMLLPLFRIFLWVKQAALGKLVVPDVNWMLTISSECRVSSVSTPCGEGPPSSKTSSYFNIAPKCSSLLIRPWEFSTTMIFWIEGTAWEWIEVEKLGTSSMSNGTFDRGGFLGKFVSVLMMRCFADRCDNAEITWEALKAGLSGT